jgi:hypothetical protein
MRREARRTLHSLSAAYQTGVDSSEYEVIAIDNGSALPLSEQEVQNHGPNFQYHFFSTDSVSPVDAVNAGVKMATGEYISVIVDGARGGTEKCRHFLVGEAGAIHPIRCRHLRVFSYQKVSLTTVSVTLMLEQWNNLTVRQ